MKIPIHLKHKPIIQVENYDKIDGADKNETDAMGLSVGIAQWNTSGRTQLSAKVWRHTDTKWSRQSEELPLHRVIDLKSLICKSIDFNNSGTLSSNEDFPVTCAADNPDLAHQIELMKKELEDDKNNLKASFKRPAEALKRIGY